LGAMEDVCGIELGFAIGCGGGCAVELGEGAWDDAGLVVEEGCSDGGGAEVKGEDGLHFGRELVWGRRGGFAKRGWE